MSSISRNAIVLAGLLLIIASALPLFASAQTTQFRNDIFTKDWWVTQPAKFANDIFNPTWWKTQPSKFINDIFNSNWVTDLKSKFVNDIFNSEWASDMKTKFVNDIFNSKWLADQKTKFFNDIFSQKSIDNLINSMTSGFSANPPSGAAPTSSGEDCWALYDSSCYAKCNSEIDCLKVCSQKFAQCMKNNQ